MVIKLNVQRASVYVIFYFIFLGKTHHQDIYGAFLDRYPYIVAVEYRYNETYCAGAVISVTHVLTMSTCVANFDYGKGLWRANHPDRMIVAAGIRHLIYDTDISQIRRVVSYKWSSTIYPPNSTLWLDLILLVVDLPFTFSTKQYGRIVRPLGVFPEKHMFRLKTLLMRLGALSSTDCFTVGWGFSGSASATTLQAIPTRLQPNCSFDPCSVDLPYCRVPYCEQPHICGVFTTVDRVCGGLKGNLLVCSGQVMGFVSVPPSCTNPLHGRVVYIRMDEALPLIHKGTPSVFTIGFHVQSRSSSFLRVKYLTHFITIVVIRRLL